MEVGDESEAKMEELVKTKEELEVAKERATQSWLDSKPLIDELETLRASLASARNRASMSNVIISELETELETTSKLIRLKKENELKSRGDVDEINRELDRIREELDNLKMVNDAERRARSKLRQVLRLRKQTLRTLQLTIRAARIESEAFGVSAGVAFEHIRNLEIDNLTVQLTPEEYHASKRRANEETSLADWRISVSLEQKKAAEGNCKLALSRLKDLQSGKVTRRRRMKEENRFDGDAIREVEDERGLEPAGDRKSPFPKARMRVMSEANRRESRDPKQAKRSMSNNNNHKMMKRSKPSIFQAFKKCFVMKLRQLFH